MNAGMDFQALKESSHALLWIKNGMFLSYRLLHTSLTAATHWECCIGWNWSTIKPTLTCRIVRAVSCTAGMHRLVFISSKPTRKIIPNVSGTEFAAVPLRFLGRQGLGSILVCLLRPGFAAPPLGVVTKLDGWASIVLRQAKVGLRGAEIHASCILAGSMIDVVCCTRMQQKGQETGQELRPSKSIIDHTVECIAPHLPLLAAGKKTSTLL